MSSKPGFQDVNEGSSSIVRKCGAILLALTMLIGACSVGGETEIVDGTDGAPTPTAVSSTDSATSVQAPTADAAVATAIPQPTAIPQATTVPDPAQDFERFESLGAGFSIGHPAGWFVDVLDGADLFASNPVLLDGADPGEEGALAVVVVLNTQDVGSSDPAVALADFVLGLDLGSDQTIVDGPNVSNVNGLEVASSTIESISDSGTEVIGTAAALIGAERSALFFGATPQPTGPDFLSTFDAMINSIEVTQIAVGGDGSAEPLAIGGSAQGAIVDASQPLSFEFVAEAGDIVDVTVEPIGEELDVVVDILDSNQNSLIGDEVDDSFGIEFVGGLLLAESGIYTVQVRSYAEAVGSVSVALDLVASAPSNAELVEVGSFGSVAVTDVEVEYGTFVALRFDWIDVTVLPEGDFDVVVDIQDSTGTSILPEGPVDRSFDTEFIRVLEIPATGYYTIVLAGFEGAAGSAEVSVAASNNGLPGSVVRGLDSSIDAEDTQFFPFEGPAGDVVTLTVDPAAGQDVVIAVRERPSEALLVEVDNSTGFEEVAFELPENGSYAFEVFSFDGSAVEYSFILLAPETTVVELAPGDEISGRFGDAPSLQYSFYPPAGSSTLFAQGINNTDVVLGLFDIQTEELIEVDETGRDSEEILTFETEADTVYSLDVSSFYGGGLFQMFVESN